MYMFTCMYMHVCAHLCLWGVCACVCGIYPMSLPKWLWLHFEAACAATSVMTCKRLVSFELLKSPGDIKNIPRIQADDTSEQLSGRNGDWTVNLFSPPRWSAAGSTATPANPTLISPSRHFCTAPTNPAFHSSQWSRLSPVCPCCGLATFRSHSDVF